MYNLHLRAAPRRVVAGRSRLAGRDGLQYSPNGRGRGGAIRKPATQATGPLALPASTSECTSLFQCQVNRVHPDGSIFAREAADCGSTHRIVLVDLYEAEHHAQTPSHRGVSPYSTPYIGHTMQPSRLGAARVLRTPHRANHSWCTAVTAIDHTDTSSFLATSFTAIRVCRRAVTAVTARHKPQHRSHACATPCSPCNVLQARAALCIPAGLRAGAGPDC